MPAQEIHLAVGDASLADSLDLQGSAGTGGKYVLPVVSVTGATEQVRGGVAWFGGSSGNKRGVPGNDLSMINFGLIVFGTSADDLWANWRAVGRILELGRRASNNGLGPGAVLWVKLLGASNFIFIDVLDGSFRPIDLGLPASDPVYGGWLNLTCLPYARGAVITDTVSATKINGNPGFIYRAAVPGDLDALCRLTLRDISTNGKVIQKIRLARRSLPTLAQADFTPIYAVAPLPPGSYLSDATALGGNAARLTTSTVWQNLARVTGAASVYALAGGKNQGEFDVLAKVRDTTATPPGAPTSLSGTVNPTGGSLSPGSYQFSVVSLDSLGHPSSSPSVITVLVPTPAAGVTALFSDTFESGTLANWTVTTSGADNHTLFSDTFEAGNLANWTVQNGIVGTAQVLTTAAYAGSYGMSLQNPNTDNSVLAGAQVSRSMPAQPASNIVSVQIRFFVVANSSTYNDHSTLLQLGAWNIGYNYTSSTPLQVRAYPSGTLVTSVACSTGIWHLLEVTYDASGASPVGTIRLDGTAIVTAADSSSFPDTLWMGGFSNPQFEFHIDNVLILDAPSSAVTHVSGTAQVLSSAAYAGSYGLSIQNPNTDHTVIAGATVTRAMPAAPASHILSVQARFFPVAVGSPFNDNVTVMQVGAWNVTYNDTSGTPLQVRAYPSGTLAASASCSTGVWHLLEITYDASGASPVGTIHLDGALVYQGADVASYPTTLTLGGSSLAQYEFHIDNVLIANGYIGTAGIVTPPGASIALTWTPGSGVANHSVYWALNGGTSFRVTTGSASGAYTLSTMTPTGYVVENPPVGLFSSANTQLRAQTAIAAPTPVLKDGPVIQTQLANGVWEMVNFGTLELPPVSTPDGQNPQSWYIQIQAKNPGGATATIDIDAVWLLPHDEPQMTAEIPGDGLSALRIWQIDGNRFGRPSAILQNESDGTTQGQAVTTGAFTLGRGDNVIIVLVETGATLSGKSVAVADVVNAQYTVQLRITPRYEFQIGAP